MAKGISTRTLSPVKVKVTYKISDKINMKFEKASNPYLPYIKRLNQFILVTPNK